MDWQDTPQQAEFRAKVRAFFEDNLPQRYREDAGPLRPHMIRASNGEEILATHADWGNDRYSEDPAVKGAADDWAKALAAEGYVASSWPVDLGGAGFHDARAVHLQRGTRARPARRASVGPARCSSAPCSWSTAGEEQKAKSMPPIAAGEIDWAQGYSEPGSGSDLASLQCRAVRDGDEFVVNGQKLWSQPLTSDAMYTLVRTDPEAPKHRGISFLMDRGPDGPRDHDGRAADHGRRLPRQRRDLLPRRARPGFQPDWRGEPGLVRRHDAHGLRPRQPLRHRRGPPGARPPRRLRPDGRGQTQVSRVADLPAVRGRDSPTA